MPHREPNNWPADSAVESRRSLHSEVTKDEGVWVVFPNDHPDEPGKVIGEIIRIDDSHYSVYTFDEKMKKSGHHVGTFTAVSYAIASLEFRRGRLTKKATNAIRCPHCGDPVHTVTTHGYPNYKQKPRVMNNEIITVYSDETHSGIRRPVTGLTAHLCEGDKDGVV